MNVVLFGDSNTYGLSPLGGRFENRYSNVLKKHFDNKINIFEEGLSGRTTIYHDSKRPNRKALDDVDTILTKYGQIDLLVIMLGTNDYKKDNAKDINDVKNGMKLLLDKIYSIKDIKKVLLISPILLSEYIGELDSDFDYNSYLLSCNSSKVYKELAENNNALFLDAKKYIQPGIDGEHFDEYGHVILAREIANIINSLWK